jgi:hypothetical protein
MAEGKHRETWDGQTIAVVAGLTGKAARYDDLVRGVLESERDDEDVTTGNDVADWNLAANLLGGVTT